MNEIISLIFIYGITVAVMLYLNRCDKRVSFLHGINYAIYKLHEKYPEAALFLCNDREIDNEYLKSPHKKLPSFESDLDIF